MRCFVACFNRAIAYNNKILEIWKEADSDMPDLVEAKSRLEQLKPV